MWNRVILSAGFIGVVTLTTAIAQAMDITITPSNGSTIFWDSILNYTAPGSPNGGPDFAFGVHSESPPPGKTTQWMAFKFYSNNYFTQNPSAHLTIGLLGTWNFATPNANGYIIGRGIIIGNSSGRHHGTGCPGSPKAEVELYWNWGPGNALIPSTCSPVIEENTWYNITIHANTNKWVAYWITDKLGNLVYSTSYQDTTNVCMPDNLGGYWVGSAFNTPDATSWKLYFSDFGTGWF